MATVVTGIAINALPPATTPLDGSEIVPMMAGGVAQQATTQDIADLVPPGAATVVVGGGGVDSTLTAPLTYTLKLTNMAQATVKGRAAGAGTGAPQDLTQAQLTALVVPGTNLVGRLNVPVLAAATRAVTATDAGKGIVQAAAAAVTLTITADATENLGDGFVTTIACSNAGGSVLITPAGGVTLVNLGDGTAGAKTITGVGIATLWRLAANTWGIHGSQNLA